MATYDLRLLAPFVALAEELHFGRAAERLHVAQPALSRQVQRLEAQVGAELVRRTSRSVELTPAGTAFLAHARRALAAAERASAAAAEQAAELRLAIDLDVPASVLRRVRAFAEAHPGVRLRVTRRGQDEALAALRRGELDAVIGWESGAHDGDLPHAAIARVAFVAVVRAGDAPAHGRALRRHALLGQPLVLFERAVAPGCFDHLTRVLEGVDVVEVAPLDTPQEGQLAAVRARGGVTLVAEEHLRDTAPAGVVALPLDPPLVLDVVLFASEADEPAATLRRELA